jgi:SAM-dependent methyltransferase
MGFSGLSDLDRCLSERSLSCAECSKEYGVVDGIIDFCGRRGSLSGVNYDAPGWRAAERNRERMYETANEFNDEWLLSLPFPSRGTDTTFHSGGGAIGRNFLDLMQTIRLESGETVLDLAAGTAWTSREFARRGCDVVCTDIRTIKYHGLRSAEAYINAGEKGFYRICWRFGPIPFLSETFDLVCCQSAFQYVDSLEQMVAEIRRVLKPGGLFLLPWTGVTAPFKSAKWGPGHRLHEYLGAFRKGGFDARACPPLALYQQSIEVLRSRGGIALLLARLWSAVTLRSEAAQSAAAKILGGAMSRLFGAPTNFICTRR